MPRYNKPYKKVSIKKPYLSFKVHEPKDFELFCKTLTQNNKNLSSLVVLDILLKNENKFIFNKPFTLKLYASEAVALFQLANGVKFKETLPELYRVSLLGFFHENQNYYATTEKNINIISL